MNWLKTMALVMGLNSLGVRANDTVPDNRDKAKVSAPLYYSLTKEEIRPRKPHPKNLMTHEKKVRWQRVRNLLPPLHSSHFSAD